MLIKQPMQPRPLSSILLHARPSRKMQCSGREMRARVLGPGAPEYLMMQQGQQVPGAAQTGCYDPALPHRVRLISAGGVTQDPDEEQLENDARANPAARDGCSIK